MGRILLGLDVGGSSIKSGLVDVDEGRLVGDLASTATPQPATPGAVMGAIGVLAESFSASGPVGFAFPSVVQRGKARTAAHVHPSWIGIDGAALLQERLGRPAVFLNDADAAGLAEMKWGAGRDTPGTVLMLTFGTGIGTAIFIDGKLLPNTELGHIEFRGMDAEEWTSARIRTALKLDFPAWIARVNEFLAYMHRLLWPDVIIIGGAVSERFDEFASLLEMPAQVRPAQFAGQAGVMGAALAAANLL